MKPDRPADHVDAFLETLAIAEVPASLADLVVARLRSERATRRRRPWVLALAAAILLLVIVAGSMWIGSSLPDPTASALPSPTGSAASSDFQSSPLPSPSPTPSPTGIRLGTLAGTWATVADAPIQGRQGHTAVWTGSEMIVWGGEPGPATVDDARTSDGADGAAYDPISDTWRLLPPAPVKGRLLHSAVWTGREMVVWGGRALDGSPSADGAAYDPVTNRWQMLAPAPLVSSGSQAIVWARDQLIVVDGAVVDSNGPVHLSAASYDAVTGVWTAVPGLDLPSANAFSLAWTGNDIVLFVTAFDRPPSGFLLSPGSIQPQPSWRSISVPPQGALRADGPQIFTGTEVLVGYSLEGGGDRVAAYDPNLDSWRDASAPPLGIGGGSNTWTGTLAIFGLGTGGMDRWTVYDPTRDGWLRFSTPDEVHRDFATQVWTGDRLLVWGGFLGESFLRPPGGFAFVPEARYGIAAQDEDVAIKGVRVEVVDASRTLSAIRTPTLDELASIDRSVVGADGQNALAVALGSGSILVYWIGGPADVAARMEIDPTGRSIDLIAVPTRGDAIPLGHSLVLTFDHEIAPNQLKLSLWDGSR